ncbi:hypothetical protein HRbin17_00051 [bacterium HR17]|uniref:Uncharacterized protein n=1 Tax=Candidatus Fervidibacter japonicus TaxID=2035412 RepID=A0A2H5X8T7_9BACT|nr:hypothetical protein HRbin17_00051 [bacterium HR17]
MKKQNPEVYVLHAPKLLTRFLSEIASGASSYAVHQKMRLPTSGG